VVPQNKFEVLSSQVMQCEVKKRKQREEGAVQGMPPKGTVLEKEG